MERFAPWTTAPGRRPKSFSLLWSLAPSSQHPSSRVISLFALGRLGYVYLWRLRRCRSGFPAGQFRVQSGANAAMKIHSFVTRLGGGGGVKSLSLSLSLSLCIYLSLSRHSLGKCWTREYFHRPAPRAAYQSCPSGRRKAGRNSSKAGSLLPVTTQSLVWRSCRWRSTNSVRKKQTNKQTNKKQTGQRAQSGVRQRPIRTPDRKGKS